MEIRLIDKAHESDINIKNEPFSLFGRMIPRLDHGKWSYTIEKFDTVTEMTFPDENYEQQGKADILYYKKSIEER